MAVIGASADPTKYGNKAFRAYKQQGYQVFPVNPKATQLEGEHGEFVIKGPRSSDPDPLLLSPMLGKLLVHEKCDFSDGASAGQTGRSPGNWRDPSRSR